ncbi:hypothetical protein KC340_g12972 [Hortaea werneckii]|nr:hypothetical protein KC342_g13190 [Hortaea werneckii]KAI7072659.1 hypothetical protein KC339_g14277 [Hortaea werneckii]KAI7224901.1 hypothetical protein KC365_g10342 [Hortaea werneckii]KAI7301734.1 hypothetical protein KC340_g12972 [Hortaea werneckii]KAI7388451.1 hypothetical protein KC328_g8931 [Hortaea werneckii]
MDRLVNIKQRFRSAGSRKGQKSRAKIAKPRRTQPKGEGQNEASKDINITQSISGTQEKVMPMRSVPSALRSNISTKRVDGAVSVADLPNELPGQRRSCLSNDEVEQRGQGTTDISNIDPSVRMAADIDDQQAIRNESYIISTGEEPDDYTEGPARLVVASDGIKECAALLLTWKLSAKIQQAVEAQRDHDRLRQKAVRTLEVALNFEMNLETEIANHESRLSMLETEEIPDRERVVALQEELATLKSMLKDSCEARQAADVQKASESAALAEVQAGVIAALEEAFVHARLVASDIAGMPEIPDMDLQTEYLKYRSTQHEDSHDTNAFTAAPLDTNDEHLQAAPLSEEEQRTKDLAESFFIAQARLQKAHDAFDSREMRREQEWQANVDAGTRGEEVRDATPEDFDARWLQHVQELTREVIDAEAEVAEAKKAALEAGIDVANDEADSGFLDDVEDGYLLSKEQEVVDIAAGSTIKGWLDRLPSDKLDSPGLRSDADVDEWETRTVGISDSVSLVAEGSVRRRIDEWNRISLQIGQSVAQN